MILPFFSSEDDDDDGCDGTIIISIINCIIFGRNETA